MIKLRSAAVLAVVLVSFAFSAQAQSLMKRTTSKTDKFDFSAGGSVSIVGAPNGSITVVGSPKNEIEITADIEMQAATAADLERLADVTTFVLEESPGRAGIITVGTHNKLGDKKLWKKFPKELIGLPFRIDYTVRVPRYCDLQIDGGKGDLKVSGVEGQIRVNSIESDARLDLIGGGLTATFAAGSVDVTMPDRSWRGSAIDIQMVSGKMQVQLPANLSADLDAVILRSGKIENGITGFKQRDRHVQFTDRSILAKAGNGGVTMKFTVGEGTLKLVPLAKP